MKVPLVLPRSLTSKVPLPSGVTLAWRALTWGKGIATTPVPLTRPRITASVPMLAWDGASSAAGMEPVSVGTAMRLARGPSSSATGSR